jgi:prepilin-type N-terminal cleavage/methylation domain-containing protein
VRTERRGMTLIEMLIALIIFVTAFSVAIPFFRVNARSVSASAGRLDALQNARYAQNSIDRDLRIAGDGIVPSQPLLVQADPFAITFNVDLTTTDRGDAAAVYYDPDVDSTTAISMKNTAKVTLPWSAVTYPDSNYSAGPIPSRAETVSYWVSVDSTSGRSDQYVLFRRVNNAPPRVVSKGIIINSGDSFFTYFKPDSTGKLDSIKTSTLPLYHTAAIHGAANDTGKSALTDSIRVVRVKISGVYKDPQNGDVIRTVESSIELLNSGLLTSTVCGDTPLPASGQAAVYVAVPKKVTISWSKSIDQDAGEKDVERYAIFKRKTTSSSWGEPIASVSASQNTYTLDDTNLSTGLWQYAIMAQDCSPANSTLAVTNTVNVP